MYLSKYDLSGCIAFVTGGGRGIGLSAAEALLEAGAEVIISDIDPSLLEQAKASLSGKGAVDTLVLDITDSAAVAAAAKAADARHGGVDILIANAGAAWPDTPGEAMSDDVWRKVIDIDLNGAYWSCREFGRAMIEGGRGSIVTVGSMSGVALSHEHELAAQVRKSQLGIILPSRFSMLRTLRLGGGGACDGM